VFIFAPLGLTAVYFIFAATGDRPIIVQGLFVIFSNNARSSRA
jgi:hypothetical protein